MTKIEQPKIDQRPAQPYLGIRTQTPMKGMFKVVSKLFKELNAWAKRLAGDERVRPGGLPTGRYAHLIYVGSGYAGNKALVDWTRANGVAWDRWDDQKGDGFRARCETYLTDPALEQRKTKWQFEVAIKLAGKPSARPAKIG